MSGSLQPGARVHHPDFGAGVVVGISADGYVQVFFAAGERQVHRDSLQEALSRTEQILSNVAGGAQRLRSVWLYVEAHALPLMENAAALTAAPIDLLPHQVVLTHRIATASPRRFLIADEVGLGKTIEAALILRELASRGEMARALMVVPAGLVNNWHRELNEVFNLDFEVFGAQGDVTDRRSNAFARHDRLIASIDTLKRPERVRRLKEAPPWDLVVIDEAHHLSAYRFGRKVTKTDNYRLAEALRGHSRDVLLLSATPHQGDHFRFWMLVQLLNPTLFRDPEEMVDQRHRLNAVVFRRTKADACRPDGAPLFARRWVHTESFTMTEGERLFYARLREYLIDGFNLARKQGSKGRSLGFVMTIFQKIAASSFAAVRSTLHRRLLMLTIHEAILKDQSLDIDGHLALTNQARDIVRAVHDLPDDAIGRSEADRILADLRLRLLRRLDEDDLALMAAPETSEEQSAVGEELAVSAVAVCLPEERQRIGELLAVFPASRETKIEKLLRGLGALWSQNSRERVVVFATYLATVDLLAREIEGAYPGQGVVVLKGGDHGAKLAAERRFRRADGPRVLVCTAAGREGINLQFARVLFNFDLPWNPMDVEQRIGRIHRYGQKDTAQVYNLVLSDTIEGRIYLLLSDKLTEIARALGKVDEQGNVAEDLKGQILGQLGERLSYDQLYRDALSDPELRRTRQELDAAMANASEARKVVFELFQDLERFSLDDYRPLSEIGEAKARILRFLREAVEVAGGGVTPVDADRLLVRVDAESLPRQCTLDRELAQEHEGVELLGVDHPWVTAAMQRCRSLEPAALGAVSALDVQRAAVLSVWFVQSFGRPGEAASFVVPIAMDTGGHRLPAIERSYRDCLATPGDGTTLTAGDRRRVFTEHVEPALQRELAQRGLASVERSFAAELLAWVDIVPRRPGG